MATKTEMRFFFLPDFEKEEAYLADKHRQGWKFARNRLGFLFTFEQCQPEEVVYQLDFKPKSQDKSEYIQFFADYGWEYLGDCNHFSYFRKPRKAGDIELYSDRQSKLDMIERILKRQFSLAFFLFTFFALLFSMLAMPEAFWGLVLVNLPILVYCLVGLLRLRQHFQEVG